MKLTRLLGLVLIALAVLTIAISCASLWKPFLLGEEVRWDLSTGELKRERLILGMRFTLRNEHSGTEELFKGFERSPKSELLVFRRSILQPRRSFSGMAQALSMVRLLCQSPRFEKLPEESRYKLRALLENQNMPEFKSYFDTLWNEVEQQK